MPACGVDLFFDKVVVVQQPLARRRDPQAVVHQPGEQGIRIIQQALVLGQTPQQMFAACAGMHAMRAGQCTSVHFHLIDIEQLCAERRFGMTGIDACRTAPAPEASEGT
ncbi:hypothetical protein D3C71_1327030 [compost metagenome]